ncbi:hypothetical protein [Halospeciosus flavus]|uniref:DUF7961 domain-containing protein n=1 Tax=Halospeciosus flavus TaxID=3032283 RepID=A0ABD5Z2Q1_9EURY|nr:hypothetical protein [Halospeciosus flavus]
MSTTQTPDVTDAVARCRPTDRTPVAIDAAQLDSTARSHLRSFKAALDAEGYVPDELVVETCFDADCTLTAQEEVERVRDYVEAAAFLGAATVTVEVEDVVAPEKVRPSLRATAERAERNGVSLVVDGPLAL